MLGSMPNLKFVFLNGCCTDTLLEDLEKHNIQAVIGTSVPIGDKKATRFSTTFYQSLAKANSLEKAFDLAKAAVHFVDEEEIEVRAIGRQSRSNGKFAWGLYKQNDDILKYVIPNKPFILPTPVADAENVNNVLRKAMIEALLPYSDKLQMRKTFEDGGERTEPRVYQQIIFEVLPVPIGIEMRRLFQDTVLSDKRLQQFTVVYRRQLQLLSYILLAQLWELFYANEELSLDVPLKMALQEFVCTNNEKKDFDDFIKVNRMMRQYFQASDIPIYVVELPQVAEDFNQDGELRNAHNCLDELAQLVSSQYQFTGPELQEWNAKAEEALGLLFKHLGFSCGYKFVTIKDIDLQKERFMPPTYYVRKVNLDNISAGLEYSVADFSSYTEDRSVVLLKDQLDLQTSLNLSPFIIDEHAMIKDQKQSKLWLFSHYDKVDEQVRYKLMRESDAKINMNPAITKPQEEFKKFWETVFR